MLAIVCVSGVSLGDAIDILSQTHHAWGNIEDVSYDILNGAPVAGADSKYVTSDGSGWVYVSSATLGSSAGKAVADAMVSSDGPWLISNQPRSSTNSSRSPPT